MIEQCPSLVEATKQKISWKCVDHRLPKEFQEECTLRVVQPYMAGGYILKNTEGDEIRLSGNGNPTYSYREFQSIDIEYIKK